MIKWTPAIAAAVTFFVVGCSSGGNETSKTGTTEPGGPAGKLTGNLEVQAFKGGYDIDFYQQAAKEFEAKNPGLKITVEGNPRVWEQLKLRFAGGDPPDLTFPGWGMDVWTLVDEGQLEDLTPALQEKAAEGDSTWGDTFQPQLLKLGQQDGKQYMLPYYVMVYGWWYDPAQFAKNGWTPPKTWDELLALCEKIKAKGIAPITYQGKYPYYMIDGMLLPWALSVGGPDAVKAAQNLEPGAWKSPAMLKAAQMIDELNKKGYFQRGATGIDHTESQMQFLQGKAAMIPCGTWLYSEMHKNIPKGMKMQFMLPPVVASGKGEPSSLLIGIEPWMVPTEGKNKKAGIEFFKYMTSLTKAKEFVEKKGTLMSIKGSESAKLPEVLVEPSKVFNASKYVWAVQYRQWYPEFNKEIENALTAMLNGEMTPQQFCDKVEAEAEKVRQDKDITKHKLPS